MGLFDFFKKKPEPVQKAVVKPAAKAEAGPGKPTVQKKAKKKKEKQIGKVIHTFNKISVAVIKLKSDIKVGDAIHIKGRYTDFTMKVRSMQIEHQQIEAATKGQEIAIKVTDRVRGNDKVFLSPGE